MGETQDTQAGTGASAEDPVVVDLSPEAQAAEVQAEASGDATTASAPVEAYLADLAEAYLAALADLPDTEEVGAARLFAETSRMWMERHMAAHPVGTGDAGQAGGQAVEEAPAFTAPPAPAI